jgi:hypothetical protein
MVKMGRNLALTHTTCNSHTGNFIAKDILDIETSIAVSSILKEFKSTGMEKALINLNGTRVVLHHVKLVVQSQKSV